MHVYVSQWILYTSLLLYYCLLNLFTVNEFYFLETIKLLSFAQRLHVMELGVTITKLTNKEFICCQENDKNVQHFHDSSKNNKIIDCVSTILHEHKIYRAVWCKKNNSMIHQLFKKMWHFLYNFIENVLNFSINSIETPPLLALTW